MSTSHLIPVRYIYSCNFNLITDTTKSSSISGVGMEVSMAAQYVKQKLEMGRARVWTDVQSKVAALVMTCEPADLKFEEFLQILDLVDRFISVLVSFVVQQMIFDFSFQVGQSR